MEKNISKTKAMLALKRRNRGQNATQIKESHGRMMRNGSYERYIITGIPLRIWIASLDLYKRS